MSGQRTGHRAASRWKVRSLYEFRKFITGGEVRSAGQGVRTAVGVGGAYQVTVESGQWGRKKRATCKER